VRLDHAKPTLAETHSKSTAIRELRPWRQEPVAQDVHVRLITLMTLNYR
jgi:hypothetical protein